MSPMRPNLGIQGVQLRPSALGKYHTIGGGDNQFLDYNRLNYTQVSASALNNLNG